jgi:hypothetical protein
MFDAIRRSVSTISLPFATVDAQEEEFSLEIMEEQLEEEERAERFSIGSYYAPIELPSSREEMQLELAQQGYELSEPPQGGGGGLLVTRGKVVIDGSGAGAGGTDDNEKSYGYGHGSLNLGYIVARSRWFRIYPLLGVGGGGGTIEVETDEGGESSQDATSAERPGFGWFNAGVGMDVMFRFWRLSFFAGLRVGAAIQLSQARGITPRPFLRVITGSSLHV